MQTYTMPYQLSLFIYKNKTVAARTKFGQNIVSYHFSHLTLGTARDDEREIVFKSKICLQYKDLVVYRLWSDKNTSSNRWKLNLQSIGLYIGSFHFSARYQKIMLY